MSLREPKIAAGQVLIAGFEGEPDAILESLQRRELGGVILFKRNVGTLEEVADLNRRIALAAAPDLPPVIAVDQEGGRVARLGPPVLTLPPMRCLGATDDLELIEAAGEALGCQLAALGFNVDFAPVLDVDTNPQNPVIGDRAFGTTPSQVIRGGLTFARGLERAGLRSCAKHFPGHGDTAVDSHLALPRLECDRERLERVELAPFRAAAAAGVPMIMTAHVVFDALDPGVPATLSRRIVTDLLRVEMEYGGVIVSDDLEMHAIRDHHGVGDAACAAIEAGCDAILVCKVRDLVDEAREALARRAERDPAFAKQLFAAADRFIAMRRDYPPRPLEPGRVRAAVDDDGAREIARRITKALAR